MSYRSFADGHYDDTSRRLLCSLSTNWWAFVVRGALALVLSALAFWMPTQALLAFTLVFGAFSFADGVLVLIAAVYNIREGQRWGWLAFSGTLGILTGIVVIVWPLTASLALASFLWASIAFWSIFTGVFEIFAAIRLRHEIRGEIWLILSGAISVVLGGIVIWLFLTRPLETFVAAGWLLASYALISGIILTLLGLRLRRLH
jgi:uncharacterized membrane protein HdeD (DUF308 family)